MRSKKLANKRQGCKRPLLTSVGRCGEFVLDFEKGECVQVFCEVCQEDQSLTEEIEILNKELVEAESHLACISYLHKNHLKAFLVLWGLFTGGLGALAVYFGGKL